ncbi:hypothetical protein, partial [Rhodovulum sulfidophilum]|uniref:hypothetical protein n=1 Tax=Rhodovulum sulfidophilum TaxID=35806 RepID=UPI001F2804ED
MQEKPLESVELDLLAVIRQIHAEEGPFGRDLLLVRARGRGLEVSRPLGRLKDLGLVEEIERKPSVLRRLFGAKPEALLRPTASGLALGSEAMASETTATIEAVTEAGTGPEFGTGPQTGTETEAPAPAPETPRETVDETTRETAARAPATDE